MLVEIAIGDAMGAGFEFAKPERLAQLKNDLGQYYPHNLPGHLPPGSYTDDTQMSIALAEHIISNEPWTKENLAQRFVATYKRDPRNGYSRGFQTLLDMVENGQDLLNVMVPNSDRCGAAMRSCPIGLFPHEFDVIRRARIQSAITHDTEAGFVSSAAIALSVHCFIYNKGPKTKLIDYLLKQEPTVYLFKNSTDLWPIGSRVSSEAYPCVKAAISAVIRNKSLAECLKECIDYTGDVDSVAAMAMGVASCVKVGMKKDLPLNIQNGLENGKFGLEYIKELDKNLFKKFDL